MRTIHATAVAVRGRGVLLVGASGSGKSDLALRLLDRGALLVADDRVVVRALPAGLALSAPPPIAGLLEVRGVGLLPFPHVEAMAALIVDLALPPVRLPEAQCLPGAQWREVEGVRLPLLGLAPFEGTAALKVELALQLSGQPSGKGETP